MLPRHGHTSEAGLRRVQSGNKLRRVARVAPHHRSVIAHVGRWQGKEWLACLVRGNGSNVSGEEAGLGGLSFPTLVVGPTVRAAVAAVCTGSDMAGVRCVVRTF